jgi:4-azaleucine resistance transporter AzlC
VSGVRGEPRAGRPAPAIDRTILRDAVTIAVAVGLIGASFGLISASRGVPYVQTQGMSLLVFAGGSQFVLLGGIGSGLAAAVVSALLLNARHVAFGLAVAPLVGGPPWRRALSSHIIVDESTAYALAQPDPRRSRQGLYVVGALLFVAWQVGTAVGALAGEAVDHRSLGIDAAFPAGMLALLVPQLRDRQTRLTALAAAGTAVALTPLLTPGAPMLAAALVALAIHLAAGRRT